MKYDILKAQSGMKIPTNPEHKDYPKPTLQGEFKKDSTSKLNRLVSNTYEDKVKGTPLEGLLNTVIPSAAIATGNPIASNVGLGKLGLGSGNMLVDASLGGVGVAAKFAAPLLKTSKALLPKVSSINALENASDSKRIIDTLPEEQVLQEVAPSWQKVLHYAGKPGEWLNNRATKVAKAINKDLAKVSPTASTVFKKVVNETSQQNT